MITTFISTFLLWACVYYAIWRWEPRCFLGFSSFLSAFLFSIETQNTIGECTHPAATSGAFGYAGWLTGCWRYRMTVHACASAAESTGAATHHTLLLSPQCPTSCCLLAPPPHTHVQGTAHTPSATAGCRRGWWGSSVSWRCCWRRSSWESSLPRSATPRGAAGPSSSANAAASHAGTASSSCECGQCLWAPRRSSKKGGKGRGRGVWVWAGTYNRRHVCLGGGLAGDDVTVETCRHM